MPTFRALTPIRRVMVQISPGPSGRPKLDLDVHAGGEVELHQRVQRLRRRVDDVEQAAMSPDLNLLAALLVDVRAAVDGELLEFGRQWNRSAHLRAGPLGRVDDLARRLVEDAMIKRLQADADALMFHFQPLSLQLSAIGGGRPPTAPPPPLHLTFSPTPRPPHRP